MSANASTMPAGPVKKVFVVIFDLESRQGDYGRQIADSIRLRLSRHGEFDVVDGLTTRDLSGPVGASTKAENVRKLMDQAAVTVSIYGTVDKDAGGVKADVRCLEISDGAKSLEHARTFTDSTERARGEIARQVVQLITGADEWVPPQYGDEAEPKQLGKPLNTNGDFEKAHAGWDHPDNVSTFIEKGEGTRGGILRVKTDLDRDPWLEYTRNIRLGLADPTKPPAIKRDTSYGSVAGLEGVHYRSDWIKATPGQRYWLVADHKGPGGAKVFVKGYRDAADQADGLPELSLVELKMTAAVFAKLPADQQKKLIADDAKAHPERYRRECYRWYLNCAESKGQWKHFAAVMPPRGGLPANVQYFQIQIYSYWPPGEYLWDNVHLYADPNQKAASPEEKPRTPGN